MTCNFQDQNLFLLVSPPNFNVASILQHPVLITNILVKETNLN